MKTQNEVIGFIKLLSINNNDTFAWIRESIVPALDFDNAKKVLKFKQGVTSDNAKKVLKFKQGVTSDKWDKASSRLITDQDVINAMTEYLPFAWNKADNERSISANRSIEHYIGWLWLISDDMYDKVSHEYEHNYCDYGKPILKMIDDFIKKWQKDNNKGMN